MLSKQERHQLAARIRMGETMIPPGRLLPKAVWVVVGDESINGLMHPRHVYALGVMVGKYKWVRGPKPGLEARHWAGDTNPEPDPPLPMLDSVLAYLERDL